MEERVVRRVSQLRRNDDHRVGLASDSEGGRYQCHFSTYSGSDSGSAWETVGPPGGVRGVVQ